MHAYSPLELDDITGWTDTAYSSIYLHAQCHYSLHSHPLSVTSSAVRTHTSRMTLCTDRHSLHTIAMEYSYTGWSYICLRTMSALLTLQTSPLMFTPAALGKPSSSSIQPLGPSRILPHCSRDTQDRLYYVPNQAKMSSKR